jgi:hypothetical protein
LLQISFMTSHMTHKNQRILDVVKHLEIKYGANNILIKDYWESDENAIGLTDKSNRYLGYISIINGRDDSYYLALENPPVKEGFPYSPAGQFDNISLIELEKLLSKHFDLI